MPANALRSYHLHQHLIRSAAGRTPEQVRALRLHPDWPLCTAGCRWPVDPAAGTTHPSCGGTS